MKKIILTLAVLLIATPALATVTITLEDLGGGDVAVKYVTSDSNLPRAFGLDIAVDMGQNITSVVAAKVGESNSTSKGYGIFPGTIDINEDTGVVIHTSPVAPVNDPGAAGALPGPACTVELGSLYDMGDSNNAPEPNGTLCIVSVLVLADCNLCVTVNPTRCGKTEGDLDAGVVMEDGTAVVPDLACIPLSAAACPTCKGDLVGATSSDPPNGTVDLTDLLKLGGLMNKAKYYNDDYSFVLGDPNVNFANDACVDIVGATSSDPPNGTVDLTDLLKLGGWMNKAKYYNGDYTFECGDPNI